MPKYIFKHAKCGKISEHIVLRPLLEGDVLLLECPRCLHIDMLVKQPNVNAPVLRGCTLPGENN